MVKSYQRYEPLRSFGVIASPGANILQHVEQDNDNHKTLVVVPALETVQVWDLKTGECLARWIDSDSKNAEVTVLARGSSSYAAGYSDGTIRIWNWQRGMKDAHLVVTLKGHRTAVSALTFDESGTRLASGGKDTDIVIWDVVAEVGLFRLRGHRDQVTRVSFLATSKLSEEADTSDTPSYIVSSSKDTLLKIWDLTTQHCVETLVAHKEEVWSFDVYAGGYIVSGGASREIKVWKMNLKLLQQGVLETKDGKEKCLTLYGNIDRTSDKRIATIQFHPNGQYLGCQAIDRSVELYRLRTAEEIRRKQARKKRRQREKEKKAAGDTAEIEANMQVDISKDEDVTPSDRFEPYVIIRPSARARSFQFLCNTPNDTVQLVVSCANNKLESYSIASTDTSTPDYVRLHSVELAGHRSDVRVVAISSDDELVASASNGILKIWNAQTGSCIRSLECGNAVCGAFLPGNRQVVIGTEAGDLEVFDIAASTLLERHEKAHEGTLWSLQVRSDGRELLTGGGDKQVKFWDIGVKEAVLTQTRILKMTEDVLCVRYSHHEDPKRRLVAVALLDSTVKVFFADTLKFFLSLYGHRLPVLSMDISHDSKLLVTCSADKNVKIWGLDFGDCHKSIFAHEDSIMQVSFVADTHRFFTVSKDRLVKHWDGDKFENIQKLEGHHGEVWALATSKSGEFVVTGSHDRSIRIWEQTDEELFLEEEREKELEELYENVEQNAYDEDGPQDDAAPAGLETKETLMDGEKILEALEMGEEERAKMQAYDEARRSGQKIPMPAKNPLLTALGDISIEMHVLRVIEKVNASRLQDALLVLPFDKVLTLFAFLDHWASKEWNTPLTCRTLFFLLKVHHDQIVANRLMRPMLDSIRVHLRRGLTRQKDTIGYNIAGIKYIRREWENNNTAEFFDEQTDDVKKRKFVTL